MSKTYKLKIMYDGSFFKGYAKQENQKTIQGDIEQALQELFNHKINVYGSGRTDKYVHAIDQTIHFKLKQETNIEPFQIQKVLNNKLNGIYIKSIEEVPSTFHSRFSIKSKTYCYVINTGNFNIFRQNYELQYNKKLDVEKINSIKDLFIGTKDFKSFSTSDNEDTIRTIHRIEILEEKNRVMIFINGAGFLRNMVRMIIATFIAYSENEIDFNHINQLFLNPKKGSSCLKAKGCGLYLFETIY